MEDGRKGRHTEGNIGNELALTGHDHRSSSLRDEH